MYLENKRLEVNNEAEGIPETLIYPHHLELMYENKIVKCEFLLETHGKGK